MIATFRYDCLSEPGTATKTPTYGKERQRDARDMYEAFQAYLDRVDPNAMVVNEEKGKRRKLTHDAGGKIINEETIDCTYKRVVHLPATNTTVCCSLPAVNDPSFRSLVDHFEATITSGSDDRTIADGLMNVLAKLAPDVVQHVVYKDERESA